MSDILHFVQYNKQSKASEDLGNVLWKRINRRPLSIDRTEETSYQFERQTQTDWDRHTDTHRIKLSHRQTQRQTDTYTDTNRHRQTKTDRHKDRQNQNQRQTDPKTDRDRHKDRQNQNQRQTHTQTQRHTDRDRNINILIPLPFQKVVMPPVEHSQQGISKPTQTGLYERQRHKLNSCSSKQTTKGGPTFFVVVVVVFLFLLGGREENYCTESLVMQLLWGRGWLLVLGRE